MGFRHVKGIPVEEQDFVLPVPDEKDPKENETIETVEKNQLELESSGSKEKTDSVKKTTRKKTTKQTSKKTTRKKKTVAKKTTPRKNTTKKTSGAS